MKLSEMHAGQMVGVAKYSRKANNVGIVLDPSYWTTERTHRGIVARKGNCMNRGWTQSGIPVAVARNVWIGGEVTATTEWNFELIQPQKIKDYSAVTAERKAAEDAAQAQRNRQDTAKFLLDKYRPALVEALRSVGMTKARVSNWPTGIWSEVQITLGADELEMLVTALTGKGTPTLHDTYSTEIDL